MQSWTEAGVDTKARQGTDRSQRLCSAVVGAPAAVAYD